MVAHLKARNTRPAPNSEMHRTTIHDMCVLVCCTTDGLPAAVHVCWVVILNKHALSQRGCVKPALEK